jgi:hypothetical protein
MGVRTSSALGCAIVAAACTQNRDPCFTPPSVVSDTRVLAISVDPPSPVADLGTGTVEPVRLRTLIAGPDGSGGTFEVSWSVCAPGPDAAICPAGSVVATDGAWTRESFVEIRVPPELVAAALAADPLRGAGGIRVLAALRVAGANPELASTPILFAPPGGPRNHAPAFAGVRAAREGFPYGPLGSTELGIFSGSPNGLRPVLQEGSLEEFDTVDFAGRSIHLRERIEYSFYATPNLFVGRLGHGTTGLAVSYGNGNGSDYQADEPAPGTADPPDGLIPLTALGSGILWIVARDSRGAAAWTEISVRIQGEDPRCAKGAFPPFFDCLRGDSVFECL